MKLLLVTVALLLLGGCFGGTDTGAESADRFRQRYRDCELRLNEAYSYTVRYYVRKPDGSVWDIGSWESTGYHYDSTQIFPAK